MKTLNPGKFEITIGGETKEIVVSLGLKTELYKLITKAQLDIAALVGRVFMDEALAQLIRDKDAQINSLEQAEEPNLEAIETAQAELEVLYGEALADLEARQHATLNETAMQKIDMTEKIFTNAISCLLSDRNELGQITNKLEPDVIMWSPVYAEAQEELTELLHAVTEYITSALKKISGISEMVTEITEAASPSPSPKA
jgi:hypothetical protein